MAEIIIPDDCGNSPRKKFLAEFNIAVAQGNQDAILTAISDSIEWEVVGVKKLIGKSEINKTLESIGPNYIKRLAIEQIITHGNSASVSGRTTLKNGQSYAFADIYMFDGFSKNALIKNVTSYAIKLR